MAPKASLPLILDCDDCVMKDSDACKECVVSYLVDRPEGAIVLDHEEERALRSLSDGGLLPEVRFKKRVG